MEKTKNYAHSVKVKLLNLARIRRDDFQLILTKYALERFLARLAASEFQTEFVLKGAMLFQIWSENSHRATRDLDFLSFGSSDAATLTEKIRRICSIEIATDGLTFDLENIKASVIKADQEYEGVRLQINVFLERAKIPLRIDVGFGDVISPAIVEANFPTLLDYPEPVIRTYPPETVIAEKFQALVDLGMTNSRLKDFYDIHFLTKHFQISEDALRQAITATFEHRKTAIPKTLPIALTAEFSEDADKRMQWNSFLRKANVQDKMPLETVIADLDGFFKKLLNIE